MKEAVRSGRRANFFITENSFIDHYARDVKPLGIAVYHVLERHANYDTRSTWISTKKMAELLGYSQRQIQRTLKTLQDFRLIRILETEDRITYVVDPVPPRSKRATTPLFDHIIDLPSSNGDDDDDAQPTPMSLFATPQSDTSTRMSYTSTSVSQPASRVSQRSDIHGTAHKEEQDLLNKTQEQDLFNKSFENYDPAIDEAAHRIINTLGLPNRFFDAARSAVELQARGTKLSIDEIVQNIWVKATRRGRSRESYLEDCLAEILAEQVLAEINLPPTNNLIGIVTAALKVEAKDRELGLEETAALITTSAIEDRRRGIEINRFYFENCKWRSNAGVSKAERRKLDNLEVNARVKQRLRDRLGTP